MKRPYQITGFAIVAFAIAVVYESLQLTYYTKLGPGPGYFPFWVAVIVGVLGAAMVFTATVRETQARPADFLPSRAETVKLLAVVAMLLWTVVTLKPLGFRISIFVFFAVLLPVLGYRQPAKVVAIALAGSAGVFYIFNSLLGVPLPTGILGF